ncbi:MAG: DNA repair protein, partial [Clostridia bacterium]|nr:DNA repair protein [Clostridia bacterium]
MANNLEKQLKRLSRRELLELMLEQSKRIDALKEENERLREELDSKKIMIENSGSLAEAALRLSGVFEAAQKAADLYLENIKNGTG